MLEFRGVERFAVVVGHIRASALLVGDAPVPAFDTSVWRVVGAPLLRPTAPGPLDGVTVAVKDLFAVAGQPIGAGNPTWLAEQAPEPMCAGAVAALLGAGAQVSGIARTDEFAYSLAGQNAHYGCPPNPAVPAGISGGSSSGPAAAVALGHVAVGLGTDTGGSIRVPSSYQGLVGIRTSHGLVDRTGLLPLAPSFDTVGWMARDAATALSVAQVLAPTATARPATRTLVVATVEQQASADVVASCEERRGALVAAGSLPPCETVELAPETLESWFTAFRTVQGFEAWQYYGSWLRAHPDAVGADVAGRFAAASTITAAEAEAAAGVAAEARAALRELLDGALLVLPSSAGGAPARDAGPSTVEAERAATMRMTCIAGLAGAPAVSLPLLATADGRPAGLCLVGAPRTDLDLLDIAVRDEASPA